MYVGLILLMRWGFLDSGKVMFGTLNEKTNDTVTLHHKDIEFYVPRDVYVNLTRGCTNATQTAAEQFFYNSVLNISSGIDEPGRIKVDLTVSLFIAWVFVCITLLKGIKTSGKVVYITAPAPFIILTVLLIRGVTLPGARTGIAYLFIPPMGEDIIRLRKSPVWQQACQQIFYSLGASMGTIICMASFNDFRNDLRRDIMIITMADFFTSIAGAVVVFAVLGNMAHNLDLPVSSVAEKGHGLAFVAYPEAASLIPGSNVWAFSVLPYAAAPRRRQPVRHVRVVLAISFFLGISMTTQGGLYVLNLIDRYIGGMILPMIAVMELYTVCWFYGPERISLDVEYMLGSPPSLFLKLCWVAICPIRIDAHRGAFRDDAQSYRDQGRPLPSVGRHPRRSLRSHRSWCKFPFFACIYAKKMKFDWVKCLKPAHNWGPQDPDLYVDYIRFLRRHGVDRSVSEAYAARVEAEEDVTIASSTQGLILSSPSTSPRIGSNESLPFSSRSRPEPHLPPSVLKDVFILGMPARTDVATEDEVSVVTNTGPPKVDRTARKENEDPKA
ncbi:hypothetical protein MTO96_002311 [Rhipicephalus appendiculatus]